jgi:thermitase
MSLLTQRPTLLRYLLLLTPVIALFAGLAQTARADQLPEFVPGQVLVGLQPKSNSRELPTPAEVAQGIGEVLSYRPQLKVVQVRVGRGWQMEQAMAALRRRAGVRYAEPNYIQRITATPNDPKYNLQWAPLKIKMNQAWDIWQPVTQKVIAIIDTGVQLNHPDLANVLYRDANSNVIGYNVQQPASPPADDKGHGTHVAGTAAAEINNGVGVAGVAGWNPNVPGSTGFVRIMPVKALVNGTGTDLDVAVAVDWAVAHGASVISMSVGGTGSSNTLAGSVANAIANDVVVVAAAGNNGNTTLFYPAAYPDVISVAATDSTDTLTSFSTYGSWVKVAAPGRTIYSTYLNSGYTYMDGTSMATPHVGGEAVLLRAAFPNMTNSQISALITGNTDPYNPYSGRTIASGAGRINVYKALTAAGAGPGGLTGHTISPGAVTGGASATGTLTLVNNAPPGGTAVTLSSNNGSVSVPSSVTIPAGASSTTYNVTTQPVASSVTATINATTTDNSMTASVIVNPPLASALSMTPNVVAGGNSSTGKVTLNGAAPVGGLGVTLSSNKPDATVPASVTVPEGQTFATFTATTTPVTASTAVTIKAQTGAVIKTATLTVSPATPLSVTFSPTTAVSGYTTTGTVKLNGPAPAAGITVTLASNNADEKVPTTDFD